MECSCPYRNRSAREAAPDMATTFVIIVNHWAGKYECMFAIATIIYETRSKTSGICVTGQQRSHRHVIVIQHIMCRCGARPVVHHNVYQCSPCHPPHTRSVPVLAVSSTHGTAVLATSSTTWCTSARHVIPTLSVFSLNDIPAMRLELGTI